MMARQFLFFILMFMLAVPLSAKEEGACLLVIGEDGTLPDVSIPQNEMVLWLNDATGTPVTIVFEEVSGETPAVEGGQGFTAVGTTICTDGLVTPGRTVSLRFLAPGTYRYTVLGLKTELTGVIDVTEAE